MKKIFLVMFSLAFANPASSQVNFCPAEEIPYTFTLFEDILLINRAYHRAFCQFKEGIMYECLEKWPDDLPVSVYTIHAKVEDSGDLAFWAASETPDKAPWLIPKCE